MTTEAALSFRSITHGFDGGEVVRDVSLDIADGDLHCLLGPSGCGKTTLLRIAAGLERPWSGEVAIRGDRVSGDGGFVPPEDRRIGFLFQDYALFPHLTVRQNVLFGLASGQRNGRDGRADALMQRLGIGHAAQDYPHTLSGGQQQRVALARALAPDPALLLLDEPFSGLDTVLRRGIYEELREFLHEAGVSAVVVTHDAEEAMMLGDRITVMNAGRIEQTGTPEEVYLRPDTAFVMDFLGETNALELTRDDRGLACALGPLPHLPGTGATQACFRPEHLTIEPAEALETPGVLSALATVERKLFVGRARRYRLRLAGGELVTAFAAIRTGFAEGDSVRVSLAPDDIRLF